MINITESAVEQIKKMLASEEAPNLFLRVGVKAGGCSGFSYGMGFDDEQKETDEELKLNGLKVVVDEESKKYLNGVEIDFKNEGMSGGFTIHNPNAIATCGCGSSFRTKPEEEQLAEKCDD
ncbi:iron-sulfur cluster assembly accessory protein [Paenibacillus sp. CC-CFT747]|nr:iron-sulfur cluster assembly accessory protein [Paenibacillus sp. CC-CFT747]